MSEEKKYPSYNINVGVPTKIKSLIEIETFKYHPYGLEGFRKDIIEHIENWQSRGLAWRGHDQLTNAWRTPWDMHMRYQELMSPIISTVMVLIRNHSPETDWHVRECWVSEYLQNSGANKHEHGTDALSWSFCYYVKIPDSGPGFTLFDSSDNSMNQINVAEGDLLLFRSALEHQVYPTLERRIIISGNVIENVNDQIVSYVKYYNENVQNEDYIMSAKHHDVDIDDWSLGVKEQKLNIKLGEGY